MDANANLVCDIQYNGCVLGYLVVVKDPRQGATDQLATGTDLFYLAIPISRRSTIVRKQEKG